MSEAMERGKGTEARKKPEPEVPQENGKPVEGGPAPPADLQRADAGETAPDEGPDGEVTSADFVARKKDVRRLFAIRRDRIVDASQSLALISQPTRSGGTLLSQLFDGHPQLHVHPFEMEIGYPRKSAWPELALGDTPETWFEHLSELHTHRLFRAGYRKDTRRPGLMHDEDFPFMFVPTFQRHLFLRLVAERKIETLRDILDCYMTSYFNAWLDNQNLYSPDKRWIVGFRSGLGKPANMSAIFRSYPEGRIISAIRDPKAIIASKMGLDAAYVDRVEVALDQMVDGTRDRIKAKKVWGDRIFLLTYEQLVADPEKVMRALAKWLDIDFDPILAVPTFNRFPIMGNSSYRVERHGVFASSLKGWRKVLSDEQAAAIDKKLARVHNELVELAKAQPYGP